LTTILEEHSAGWYVSTRLQKALCIMFAALRKSNTSFVSQPVRAGNNEKSVCLGYNAVSLGKQCECFDRF